MPFSPELIGGFTTALTSPSQTVKIQQQNKTTSSSTPTAITTTKSFNSENKKSFYNSLCMNWHLGSKVFFIWFVIILSHSSMINCNNHFYVAGHHHDDEITKTEKSFSASNKNDGPFLSLESLKALSLTGSNQLRMFEEKAIPKNVTAQIGHPVYLHCIVEPIGDKMVSWIRLRDFHLLTVGRLTYTSDDRFIIRHGTLQSNDWALQIKHVTPKDQGLYECQINSDPPRSQYYYLHVVVPIAEMVGHPDMFVKAGATINLTCIISQSPEPPAFVFWYHNDRMINYDYNSIAETSVHKDTTKSDTVISRLVIRNAKLHDSGNYTCTPSNAEPTSIYVHVLQGEKQLSNGIQNDEGSSNELNTNGGGGFHASTSFSWATSVSLIILLVTFIDSIIMMT